MRSSQWMSAIFKFMPLIINNTHSHCPKDNKLYNIPNFRTHHCYPEQKQICLGTENSKCHINKGGTKERGKKRECHFHFLLTLLYPSLLTPVLLHFSLHTERIFYSFLLPEITFRVQKFEKLVHSRVLHELARISIS